MLPKEWYPYTYPISGIIGVHPSRWQDRFGKDINDDEEKAILTLDELREKKARNAAYNFWRKFHQLQPRKCLFQVVQILSNDHSEINRLEKRKDWWPEYKDMVVRVWVEPDTFYSEDGRDHKQWYVLCPEDSEMILRYEADKKGYPRPPRDEIKERWLSNDPAIRYPLAVPVECCRHFRHETTAGNLPIGL